MSTALKPVTAPAVVAYFVGKRRPLSDLPLEQQQKIREAWAETKWTPNAYECLGIVTSEADARRAASKPGYFWIELPVDELLPEELGRRMKQDFPASEASDWYRELTADGKDGSMKTPLKLASLETIEKDAVDHQPPEPVPQDLVALIKECRRVLRSMKTTAQAARLAT